ncbi:aspartate/glutamate racemase family protein [Flavobacterium sp. ZT3R18]|uniref:aspartate/glutamate racemase family protein n=1 Tax=Flavobacterium sp. ZT3R18 TaxID=2594429 RepID=UPI00117A22AE|nr:aspartate/glutamate racemase family protein [Flavobacterium sp. ZT3R18]TRX35351.1 aspartate/glutamate racemase family protein [Flavobacterium sp. ZT3R18]
MKTIGLIGGMSWESSAVYYKILNQKVNESLGGVHSCKCIMISVDFDEIAKLQHEGNWDKLGEIMIDSAKKLEKAGADFIVLCTNTMHKLSERIEENVNIPLLHIADVTAEVIKESKINKVGLLGTKFTMEQEFIKDRLINKHSIETIIPNEQQRNAIHNIIYNELVKGIINEESRKVYLEIINDLKGKGAEGIVLGCTEIMLLVNKHNTESIMFDTTEIHALKAIEFAIQ